MRMAERIQQIRLACWVTLEDVEAKTGFTKSQMVRLETGQEVPTLEMLDTLAEALDVPIFVFFYDTAEPKSAPRLVCCNTQFFTMPAATTTKIELPNAD